jgi:CBS domain-containing protein
MTVEDVMTRDVITVSPATPIHEAARVMVERAVSGLPVIDADGRLVGIISDGDLILRQRRRKETPWWHSFFTNGEQIAREYQRAVGTTVGEVMTRPVITISPVWGIEVAASILDSRNIRRLPVVQDGRLVGIVSRADLIKALAASSLSATSSRPATSLTTRGDSQDELHGPLGCHSGPTFHLKGGAFSSAIVA